jgi:hypothetical protein
LSRGAKEGNIVPVPTEPSHAEDAPPEQQASAVIHAVVRPAGDEAFLPWLRDDLERMCLEDGKLSPEEATLFGSFCSLFYTYLHLDFYERLRSVAKHYARFDPDRDTKQVRGLDREAEDGVSRVVGCFRELAERSNYFEVSPEMIARCLEEVTLIDLKTKVDLDDFEQVVCYARGDIHAETTVRKLWKTRKIKMDVLQRVVLLLKYKDAEYFERTGRPRKEELRSDRIYTFYYKNVPKYDLEFLFPNVEIGMNLKDKLLLGVPAVGGSILVLTKLVPQFLIITGLVVFLIAGPEAARRMGVSGDSAKQVLPAITALLGLTIALGGFAIKQWNAVRRKRFEFLKNVAEQLFYRKLANNQAVFDRLMSSAEAEESKEVILALYQMWTGPEDGLTASELDARLEQWIRQRLDTEVDFDIGGPIACLNRLSRSLEKYAECPLIETTGEGRLVPAPLPLAVESLKTLVRRSAVGEETEPPGDPNA